ncbi:MAG TPA: AtpZ/AtpI family protein [Gemmataceae bacterium]|nr:AtpZ/AtpI family protein [Gemmataceae bacterium]
MAKDSLHPREFGYYVSLAQVGLEMVAPVGIGIALDHYLGWSPWATIGGAVFGLIGGVAHLIALTNRRDQGIPPNPQREES